MSTLKNFIGIHHFQPSEFDSPDLPGSGSKMKRSFLKKLDKARQYAGVPFIVLSGYRTPEHNAEVGGVPDSAHTKGYAADIKAPKEYYGRILKAAMKAGIKRIGLNNGSIHLDDDPEKPQPAVWIYYDTEAFRKLKDLVLKALRTHKYSIIDLVAISLLLWVFIK